MGTPSGLNPFSLAPLVSLAANIFGPARGAAAYNPQGGVSEQQAALAEFLKRAGILTDESTFANLGMGVSTGATQATGGRQTGAALDLSKYSDAKQAAQYAASQRYAQAQGGLAGQVASNIFGGSNRGGGGGKAPPQSTVTNVSGDGSSQSDSAME